MDRSLFGSLALLAAMFAAVILSLHQIMVLVQAPMPLTWIIPFLFVLVPFLFMSLVFIFLLFKKMKA